MLKPLAGAVALLSGIAVADVARADDWNFAQEIPCPTAPVYGVPFSQCFVSNVRTFRIGNVQSWRLTYTDSKSEFAIGFYRLVEAHGVGGMSPVTSNSEIISWVRTADALKHVSAGGSNWSVTAGPSGERYVTFQKGTRQCIGFVRNGPSAAWTLGAVFCRESRTPVPTSEVQFIYDAIQVR
ncbi:MAG: hypothetical protein U1E60_13200 [Reyranellaceae bacterium]